MKPIHEFNDLWTNKLEIFHSSREKTVWFLKIFIFAENVCHSGYVKNVSLRVSLLYIKLDDESVSVDFLIMSENICGETSFL